MLSFKSRSVFGPNMVTSGLVLYLDSANKSSYIGSGTAWSDLSGNGYNGALINGPTYSSSNYGVIGFDGVNDYMATTFYSGITTPSTTHSMIAWVNTSSTTGTRGIMNIGQWSDNEFSTGIVLVDNQFYWSTNGSDAGLVISYSVASGYTLSANTWYSLGFTKTSSTVNLFVNGSLVVSAANSASGIVYPSPIMLGVGSRGGIRSGYFPGKISAASLYNRALSSSEVLQNYNALKSRFGLP